MFRRGCLYIVVALFWLTGCKETTGILNLPGGLDENYALAFTDTLTVKTSTVLLDSIPTSNIKDGVVMLGRYNDPKFGIVEASPFVQLNLVTSSLPTTAVYDSMVLLMGYSKYYYGDTSQVQTVEVRRLKEDMKAYSIPKFWKSVNQYSYLNLVVDNGYEMTSIANNKSFGVFDDVIGTSTFKPLPTGTNPMRVRLSDALGHEFFNKLLTSAPEFNSNASFTANYNFLKYFKGIKVSTSTEGAMFRLKVTTADFKIRLYYNQIDGSGKVQNLFVDFPAVPGASYNHTSFHADRSATLLADLTPSNKIVSSKVTDNEAYIESGVGLAVKLSFPSLFNIKSLQGFTQASSAYLVVEPVRGSYSSQLYLPEALMLFYTNTSNAPISPVPNRAGSAPSISGLTYNNSKGASPQYVFDVTKYVQTMTQASVSQDSPFLLTTSTTSANSNVFFSASRLVIGGEKSSYKVRLEINYLKSIN